MRSTTLRLFGLVTLMMLAGCAQPTPAPTPAATIPPSPLPATITPRPTAAPTLAETPVPVSYPMRLEQVGQLGGASRLLALGDKYLYLQVGPRLAVLDVSNASLPYIIGKSEVLGEITSITTYFDDVLVGGESGTIWRFQIDPAGQPLLLHQYQQGDPDRPKIESLPENEVSTADYTISYRPDWIEYQGWQPLTVMDSAGQEVITAFGGLPEGQLARGLNMAARGRYVYVATGFDFLILDLALPPERPYAWWPPGTDPDYLRKTMWQQVGRLEVDAGTMGSRCCMGMDYMHDICGEGPYLETDVGVWDLAEQPENPQLLPYRPGVIFPCNTLPVRGGAIKYGLNDGRYTYVAATGEGIVVEHEIATGVDAEYILGVSGDVLVLSGGYSQETDTFSLFFVDVRDPLRPTLAGTYPDLSGWTYWVSSMLVGKYLYVRAESQPTLTLDISDPANPHPAQNYPVFPFDDSLLVLGNWVYDLRGARLDVIPIHDLKTSAATLRLPDGVVSSTFIGNLYYSGVSRYVTHTEDRLYVYANHSEGTQGSLLVIDIRDPLNPFILASGQMEVYQVVSYGDYLYVHQFEKGIGIYKLVPN